MRVKGLCFYLWKRIRSSRSQRQYSTIIEELCQQFSLEDLRKSTNNFDENRLLGQGVFGRVYKGFLQHQDCAIALMRLKEKTNQLILECKNLIELLCQLRHPNLMPLIGFCDHKNEKIIVYEYMPNGSLDGYLRGGNTNARSWKKSLEICIGVARGLHYLHAGTKRTIIHLGIQPQSILLDHAMTPKLANFSLSVQGPRFMSKPKPIPSNRVLGTYGFVPLEYISQGTITDKCDVYSFGIVLLEVVCGRKDMSRTEFWERKFHPVEENIDPNIKEKIAPECWKVFMDITQRCLKREPQERPTMGEVEVQLEHALSLQEEADSQNTNGNYTLLPTTVINLGFNSLSEIEDMYL